MGERGSEIVEFWQGFLETLPAISRAPTQEMPLVCERFRLVYVESLITGCVPSTPM